MNVGLTFGPEFVAELADAVAERLGGHQGSASEDVPWRLMGVEEVACALGRSKRWVHGAVKERGLPFIRLDGGALAFDPDDVRAWAMARRVPAATAEPLAGRLQESRKHASRLDPRVRHLTVTQEVAS